MKTLILLLISLLISSCGKSNKSGSEHSIESNYLSQPTISIENKLFDIGIEFVFKVYNENFGLTNIVSCHKTKYLNSERVQILSDLKRIVSLNQYLYFIGEPIERKEIIFLIDSISSLLNERPNEEACTTKTYFIKI